MKRNFLLGLILCLVPIALASLFVGKAIMREQEGEVGFRRGVDLAGGTILVYEVNLESVKKDQQLAGNDPNAATLDEDGGLSSADIKKLAENLKRRIDPVDQRNVIVRPVGNSRVEIILPFTGSIGGGKEGATEDFVQEVKGLVRRVGVLEFRILANTQDDREAIDDAQKLLATPDSETQAELKERAEKGLPPPAPDGLYTVEVSGRDSVDDVRYEWVELGRVMRDNMGLSNKYANEPPKGTLLDPNPMYLYPELAKQRGEPVEISNNLYYSRDFIEDKPSKTEEGKEVEYFVLTRVSPADAMKITRDAGLQAFPSTDERQNPAVRFKLQGEGARRFEDLTERNKPDSKDESSFKRQMAVIMDNMVYSAPSLQGALPGGGIITGGSNGFKQAEVNDFVQILQSGALNAELKPDPVSENTVGPTLGQNTIRRGLLAIGLSFAAVLVFMLIYYRFAGVVACIALFANLLLTVGFMVAFNAAFTLPGLAGIVLMLGMAVDANVLIYERIREERTKGANLITAIRLGYDRAFGTIIDTHLTSIFTAVVLYAFGNDNLKGFAVSLTLGLIISLFTALYMTRLIFDYGMRRRWLSQLRMMRLFARPNFKFMRIRYPMFAFTATVTVLGLALFVARGDSILNVDFTKGTVYGGRLSEGEARALRTTPDGKPGLLDLLGDERQAERLNVEDVVWLTEPVDSDIVTARPTTTSDLIYKIIYANPDGEPTESIVTLANKPDGATTDEQLANLTERASQLPSLSVEQVFLTQAGEAFPETFENGKSRSFTLRTTEREAELVQVMLDRLLRTDDGTQLLQAVDVKDISVTGPTAIVKLDAPASPNYVKGFILRQLRLEGRVPEVGDSPIVEVTGIRSDNDPEARQLEDQTGRFSTLRVDVSTNPEFNALTEAQSKTLREGAFIGGVAGFNEEARRGQEVFGEVLDNAMEAFEKRPIPDRLETFDPALAADTRARALWAIVASWIAILVYLWFRFGSWTFGLAAVLCLIHDLCFTLGAIAICHYIHATWFGDILALQDFKIDLAAVAALLTLVGFSVNDTIVVFDRIREVRGKNPRLTPEMIDESVNGTLSRTVLASLTVFLVVGVLYWFGGEGIHLFSFVMVVGVIVGTYSSIYVASPLLLFLGEGKARARDRIATRSVAKVN